MRIVQLLRVFWLTLKLALARYYRALVGGVVIIVLGVVFLKQGQNWIRGGPHVYHIGIVSDMQPGDRLPPEIEKLISRGLTKLNEKGLPQPALASAWQVNEVGDEYVFETRDKLIWTDGSPFAPSDVKLEIPGVTVSFEGRNKLRFSLKNPYSPFPSILSQPLIKKELVGFGPYRVVGHKKSNGIFVFIMLEGSNARFKIKFYPNEDLAKTALKLGEVDALIGIRNPGELMNWSRVTPISHFPHNRFVAVFYNNQDEFLSDKEVRQALTYAIPREFPGKRIDGPIDPKSWAYHHQLKRYDYDLERAQTLLGNPGPAKLTLTTLPLYEELAQKIVQSWQALGLDAKLRVLPGLSEAEKFQALLIGQKTPGDPDQYSLWHSTQETNIAGYQSPKVDKILEDARRTLNHEERQQLYLEFQEQLVSDVPAAFLYQPEEYVLFTDRAKTREVQQLIGDIIS